MDRAPGRLVFLLSVLLVCAAARGSVVAVATRPVPGQNDTLVWSVFGTNGVLVPDGSVGLTVGGLAVTMAGSAAASLMRLDAGVGWSGGFNPGEALIFNNNTTGDIQMTFAQLVRGVGAQAWYNSTGGPVVIEAYGAGMSLLGSYVAQTGGSAAPNNNQATFLGLLSDATDIQSVRFYCTGGAAGSGFSINTVSLVTTGVPVVPEPATLALLGMGMAGVLARRRRA